MDTMEALGRLGGGHFLEALHNAIIQVAESVKATGRDGAVVITLKVSKPRGAADNMVVVAESIGLRMPQRDPMGAFYFLGGGRLNRDDPDQVQMDVSAAREVSDLGSDVRKGGE